MPAIFNQTPPTVRVLGSTVHLVSTQEVVDQIERWIRAGERNCRRIVVTGFHGLWEAYKDPTLRHILNSADLWVPDGIAPVWVARLRGVPDKGRTPGADIMRAYLNRAGTMQYSSYFYGDTEATLATLRERLTELFPGHRIVGMCSPPFRSLTPDEEERVLLEINSSGADVLWVALGAPKQDRWIWENRGRLRVPVAIGVGAAFQFLAGKVPRCPDWIGRMGLEWAFRLLKEPRKLWRRDLIEGLRFVFYAVLDQIHQHKLCPGVPRTSVSDSPQQ